MSDCRDCLKRHVGPLSGFEYCLAIRGAQWTTTHQARQMKAPCGPQAVLFVPRAQRMAA